MTEFFLGRFFLGELGGRFGDLQLSKSERIYVEGKFPLMDSSSGTQIGNCQVIKINNKIYADVYDYDFSKDGRLTNIISSGKKRFFPQGNVLLNDKNGYVTHYQLFGIYIDTRTSTLNNIEISQLSVSLIPDLKCQALSVDNWFKGV